MLKHVFHNSKQINETFEKRKLTLLVKKDQKEAVDINKLLNRVKINKYNEKKKKIIFFSLSTLLLIVIGTLISILK
ncbi:hypothetical protein OAD13_00755 [Candidatus Pelagibacter sp.]|nr:hypothetical protein [Candidatus Pelagibacter sp.]